MASEWYLLTSQPPIYNSGYESDDFNNYAQSGFNETLQDSPLTDDIQIYNLVTRIWDDKKAIVQNSTSDNQTSSFLRQILSIIGTFKAGDLIRHRNKLWLMMNVPDNNKIYEKGIIQLCNYTLPFQTTSTTIYNEPCIVIDSTRSSSTGEDDGKVITLTDTQALVYIQYNDKTKYLTEEKRIFLDQFTDKPKVYKITKANRISYMDGDKGLLQLTCDQEEYNSTTDSYEYKIADYISTSPSPEPEPTPEGLCLITNTTGIVYDTILELKIGGTKKPLVAQFKNSEGNVVDKTPIWSLDFGTSGLNVDNVHLTYNEAYPDRCYLAVDNNVLFIGKEFKLKLKDSENLLSEFVLNLKVVSFS